MPGELFANNAQTTLSAAVSSTTATSITVASSALFPPAVTDKSQFRVLVGQEIMLVTNVSGATWTVTRGAEATVPSTHSLGATVTHIVTAGALDNGSMRLIQSVTLTGTATTVSFPGIPQHYRTLYLSWDTGTTMYAAAAAALRINGVTAGSSHVSHHVSLSVSQSLNTTSPLGPSSTTARQTGFYWMDASTSQCMGVAYNGSYYLHGGLVTPARVFQLDIVNGAFPIGAKFELYGM